METVRPLVDAGIQSDDLKATMILYHWNKKRIKEARIADIQSNPIDPGIFVKDLGEYIENMRQRTDLDLVVDLMKKLQHYFHLNFQTTQFWLTQKSDNVSNYQNSIWQKKVKQSLNLDLLFHFIHKNFDIVILNYKLLN